MTLALFCLAVVCVFLCVSVACVGGVCYRVIRLSDCRMFLLFRVLGFAQRSHECILSPFSFRICLADRRQC